VPIPLLQEPQRVLLVTDEPDAARQIAQMGALYALGEYQAASNFLNQRPASAQPPGDRDRAWLAANILFRLEDWDAAIAAYTLAMKGRNPTDPALPQLLANRALTRLYAREATGKATAAEACRDLAQQDSRAAVQSNAALTHSEQFNIQIVY